jgi:hypothetical protein
MACTERLCLRLLRAEDAAPLREVSPPGWVEAASGPPNPASVRVLAKIGMREHARQIVRRGAQFVFTIGENQPSLFDAADALCWESLAVED